MRKILIKCNSPPRSGIVSSRWARAHLCEAWSAELVGHLGTSQACTVKEPDRQHGDDPSPAGSCQGSQESPLVCKKLHPERGKGIDWGNASLQKSGFRMTLWLKIKILHGERRGPGHSTPKPTKTGTIFSHFPSCPISHWLLLNLLMSKWSQQLDSHRNKWVTELRIRLCEHSQGSAPWVFVLCFWETLLWLPMIKTWTLMETVTLVKGDFFGLSS